MAKVTTELIFAQHWEHEYWQPRQAQWRRQGTPISSVPELHTGNGFWYSIPAIFRPFTATSPPSACQKAKACSREIALAFPGKAATQPARTCISAYSSPRPPGSYPSPPPPAAETTQSPSPSPATTPPPASTATSILWILCDFVCYTEKDVINLNPFVPARLPTLNPSKIRVFTRYL